MNHRIKGKKILITGASSGIGEQLAWKAAVGGAYPILVARSKDRLSRIASSIKRELGCRSDVYICDLLHEEEWESTMKQIVSDHGPVHVLINNAGIGYFELIQESTLSSYQQMFQLNVMALIQSVHFFLPIMAENGEGHIVNIASQAGKMATPKSAGYAATKHAVLGFTNSLRMEAEKQGIFVTAVNPGPVNTNFFQTADPEGTYKKAISRHLLQPERVAEKIVNHLYTPKREINLPLWMEAGSKLYHLAPRLMEKMFKNQFFKK
ncbi:MAG: SDR family oxidoreductase [Bacillaceae bacterium]|nr:SDR family oxidoreductase [Bacillaceae bacterium]